MGNLDCDPDCNKEEHGKLPEEEHDKSLKEEQEIQPDTENVDSSVLLNKSSTFNLPRRIIIEKHNRHKDKRYIDTSKYINHSHNSHDEENAINQSRYSTRNKIREKRSKIFRNLLQPKDRKGKLSQNNSNLRNINEYHPLSNTQSRISKQQETTSRSKLNCRNVGYGEIYKLIQKKKTRIQSAHPIAKELAMHNKLSTNLNESYTFHQKIPESRPISSAKSSMKSYLNKIIMMANKRQYPKCKVDIK